MNAIDIDRGAPPQTHGSGRRRSSIRQWGAANPPRPHGRGGPGLARGGGARSGLTRASPPTGRPGPHPGPACARRRGVRAPPRRGPAQVARRRPARGSAQRPRGSGDRGSPSCRQRPRPGRRPPVTRGGQGPAIWWLPPPFVRPALPHLWAGPPNFGASVVYTAPLAQRSEKIIGAAYLFFYNSKFKKKKIPSKVLHWPTFL
jgi:hypothetical protein